MSGAVTIVTENLGAELYKLERDKAGMILSLNRSHPFIQQVAFNPDCARTVAFLIFSLAVAVDGLPLAMKQDFEGTVEHNLKVLMG